MSMKLSFVERLSRESIYKETQRKSNTTSIDKTINSSSKQTTKTSYHQFKEHHNELKNMLKFFQETKNPESNGRSPEKILKFENSSIKMGRKIFKKQAFKENIQLKSTNHEKAKDEWMNQSVVLQKNTYTGKRGISNAGNTCYINAVVQCLFHLPRFNDYFSDQKYLLEKKKGNKKDVVEIYKNLYINVMRGTSKDVSTLPLKRTVSKICSLFIDWEQQDAHQFMKSMLNSIHEDINRAQKSSAFKLLKKSAQTTIQKLAQQSWSYYKDWDDSYIYDSFCGQIYNNLKCINCSHQSQTFQNFLDLSLPITPGNSTLNDLLEDFFSPEKLSDYYLCQNCHKSSKKSIKTVQLWKMPKFLIVHLKRSQFGKKNTDPISITESLSLKNYLGLSNDKTSKYYQYSLCGIVMHRGVIEAGHYWCRVKENGKWFQIDDEKVTEIKDQAMKNQFGKKGSSEAYILFYSSLHC